MYQIYRTYSLKKKIFNLYKYYIFMKNVKPQTMNRNLENILFMFNR